MAGQQNGRSPGPQDASGQAHLRSSWDLIQRAVGAHAGFRVGHASAGSGCPGAALCACARGGATCMFPPRGEDKSSSVPETPGAGRVAWGSSAPQGGGPGERAVTRRRARTGHEGAPRGVSSESLDSATGLRRLPTFQTKLRRRTFAFLVEDWKGNGGTCRVSDFGTDLDTKSQEWGSGAPPLPVPIDHLGPRGPCGTPHPWGACSHVLAVGRRGPPRGRGASDRSEQAGSAGGWRVALGSV